jgi:hypothetical protein
MIEPERLTHLRLAVRVVASAVVGAAAVTLYVLGLAGWSFVSPTAETVLGAVPSLLPLDLGAPLFRGHVANVAVDAVALACAFLIVFTALAAMGRARLDSGVLPGVLPGVRVCLAFFPGALDLYLQTVRWVPWGIPLRRPAIFTVALGPFYLSFFFHGDQP